MQDMENKNLKRLREETIITPPDLNAEILSPAISAPKRNMAALVLPVAASIAITFAFLASGSQHGSPRVFSFPTPSNPVMNSGTTAGPMIEAGVSFSPSPDLSDQADSATVWKLEPVDNLEARKRTLADILGYKYEIGDLTSQYVMNEDSQRDSLTVSPTTGQWLYQNLTHTLSVDGICVDTKQPGNCEIKNAHLGDDYYLQRAIEIFSAGGFKGSEKVIAIEREKDGSATATASLLIGGEESPIIWRAAWFKDGVLDDAKGFLGTLKDLGKFAILSPKAAVARADDYRQWTYQQAGNFFPWAPPVGKPSATVTSAKLTLGAYKGYLVPSYHLVGSSGTWYRDVNALAELDK